MRLPLFVFLTRQSLQPLVEHEERFSFCSDCRTVRQHRCPYFFVALYGAPRQERRREKVIEMGTKHEFEEIAIENGLFMREPVSAKASLHKATIEASVVDAKDKTIEFLSFKATAKYGNLGSARLGFMRFVAKVLSEDVIRESGMTLCPAPCNKDFYEGNGFTEFENTLEIKLDLMDVKGVQTNIPGALRPTEEIYAPTKVLRIKAMYDV